MPIVNPTPITPSVASAYWAVRVVLTPGHISAEMYPWNQAELIQSMALRKTVLIHDAASVAGVFAKVASIVGCTESAVRCVNVRAPYPDQPVQAVCIYETGPAVATEIDGEMQMITPTAVHKIPDLFAAFADDAGLAAVYDAVIAEISSEVQ